MIQSPWTTIDCRYLFPEFAASFLNVKSGRGIFIENNTARAIPRLRAALKQNDLKPEHVDYLMVTHAHLDHAGGTSELAKLCSNATVLAHPKAAKTLMNPTKIIEGAKKVYGEKRFEELYGSIEPISSDRIRIVSDGERVEWQGQSFLFFYTAGHASHHLCIFDETNQAVFTGDSFGLCYPGIKSEKPIHFPSTSPVDFDFEAACESIDRILACGAKTAFLTHFGPVIQLAERAEELKRHLRFHQSLVDQAQAQNISGPELNPFILTHLSRYFHEELEKAGVLNPAEAERLLKLDLELNAAGLAVSCVRKRKEGPR